jgi:glutamine---fructose-6-phosphate transaminase (isomerizing)
MSSFMRQEIDEQPAVIEQLLRDEAPNVERLCEQIRRRPVSLVYIAARGTSDHAAVFAKYLIEIETGLPVGLAAASEVTLYGARLKLKDALVLGISQSGEAEDVIEVLQMAREAGGLTAAITNNPASKLAGAAEYAIDCRAGKERSLPATKSYTTSLAALTLLVCGMGARPELRAALDRVPGWIRQVLTLESLVERWAERYRYLPRCVVLARGRNQATALEVALKLAETSYIEAQPYSAADFIHGPIAIVDEGFPCLLFAPGDRAYPMMRDLAARLHERRAELIIVSDQEEILQFATAGFGMSSDIDEALTPLVYVVIGQLLAYHIARVRGRDPDQPRGLSKVTVTR